MGRSASPFAGVRRRSRGGGGDVEEEESCSGTDEREPGARGKSWLD